MKKLKNRLMAAFAAAAMTGLCAEAQARPMTSGEVRMAKGMFGDAIDYSKVDIHDCKHGLPFGPLTGNRAALTIGNGIYIVPAWYADDISKADAEARANLIHELTHVWQGQTWRSLAIVAGLDMVRHGFHRAALYEFDIHARTPFRKMGVEQQASLMEDACMALAYIRLGASKFHDSRYFHGLTAGEFLREARAKQAPFPVPEA
jgi:hypothetical protein